MIKIQTSNGDLDRTCRVLPHLLNQRIKHQFSFSEFPFYKVQITCSLEINRERINQGHRISSWSLSISLYMYRNQGIYLFIYIFCIVIFIFSFFIIYIKKTSERNNLFQLITSRDKNRATQIHENIAILL